MTQTKTEMQDAIAKMQVELDELKRLHATMPDEPKQWPQEGDKVFWCDLTGVVLDGRFESHDSDMCEQGAFKRTKEEAQAVSNFRMAYTKLKAMNCGFVPDWTDAEQEKWSPIYSHERQKWDTQVRWSQRYSQLPHFPMQEMLEQAIEAMGSDMDYLLGGPV